MNKRVKVILVLAAAILLIGGISAYFIIGHFVGYPEAVGTEKNSYHVEELHVQHDSIDIYGQALIPDSGGRFSTVIYAHGAESDYQADMTTLKSLAMSGIAVYTFDFYGWTDRSTGPDGVHWFKNMPRGVDDAYERQVLRQVEDLNAVIETVKTLDFVDAEKVFLLGSSMGGATVVTCAVTHSEDIRAIILQYPAINLNPDALVDGAPLDANGYIRDVLLLQGTDDVIVPLAMSEALRDHYNMLRPDHCQMVVYEGQPHVFTGKYKVEAAKKIYQFIQEHVQ